MYRVVFVGDGNYNDAFVELHRECFPHSKYRYGPKHIRGAQWWLVEQLDLPDAKAVRSFVGFACLKLSTRWLKTGYLARAGVLPVHRGRGLHRRLIRVRTNYARTHGMEWLITETIGNPSSANNLMDAGFRAWWPDEKNRWDKRRDATFWRKKL